MRKTIIASAATVVLTIVILVGIALAADIFTIDKDGTVRFRVSDTGATTISSVDGSSPALQVNISGANNAGIRTNAAILANGADASGGAPIVLKQFPGNNGLVITDGSAVNPREIFIGWNAGATFDYMRIDALQQGIAFKDVILSAGGGRVGIGKINPGSKLSVSGLPTSPAGLTSGDIWIDTAANNVLKIVP